MKLCHNEVFQILRLVNAGIVLLKSSAGRPCSNVTLSTERQDSRFGEVATVAVGLFSCSCDFLNKVELMVKGSIILLLAS